MIFFFKFEIRSYTVYWILCHFICFVTLTIYSAMFISMFIYIDFILSISPFYLLSEMLMGHFIEN